MSVEIFFKKIIASLFYQHRPAVWVKWEQSSRITMWNDDDYSVYDNESYDPEYSYDDEEDRPRYNERNAVYLGRAIRRNWADADRARAEHAKRNVSQRLDYLDNAWRAMNRFNPRLTDAAKRTIHSNEFGFSSSWTF